MGIGNTVANAAQNAANNNNQNTNNMWGTVANIAGGAIGMLGQNARAKKAHNRSKELMGIQHQNQRNLNMQGHELQMDMWNKTNYGAQKKHMEEAGLNPALMYGMSGGGGTTAGSQGGGSAASGTSHAPMDIGSALQAGMMQAQIANLNAQTEKTTVEATKIGGVDSDEGRARIANINKATSLTEMQINETANNSMLIQAKEDYQDMLTNKQGLHYDAMINELKEKAKNLIQQTRLTKETADLTAENKEHIIALTKADALNKGMQANLAQSQDKLIKEYGGKKQAAEIAKLWADISQGYTNAFANRRNSLSGATNADTNIKMLTETQARNRALKEYEDGKISIDTYKNFISTMDVIVKGIDVGKK